MGFAARITVRHISNTSHSPLTGFQLVEAAMKVIVCVKHAIDEAELMADVNGKPKLQNAQTKMSVFDRNAVEEAIRIKETKGASIVVTSLGEDDAKKTVKEALAMGVDRGFVIRCNPAELDTLGTSYYLARAIQKEGADLILCSEGSSDTYSGQVGPMVAEWLDIPFIGYARRIEIKESGVRCEQVYEDRVEVSEAKFPVLISVVSEINEPRYTTLLQIIQASKRQIEDIPLQNLKGSDAPQTQVNVIDVNVQTMNRKKIMFEGEIDEAARKLIEALRTEQVINT